MGVEGGGRHFFFFSRNKVEKFLKRKNSRRLQSALLVILKSRAIWELSTRVQETHKPTCLQSGVSASNSCHAFLTSQCKMAFEERCTKPGHMRLSFIKGGCSLFS